MTLERLSPRGDKAPDTRWMRDALCVDHADLPWIEKTCDMNFEDRALMRAICMACPVRRECGAYAVEVRVTAGWWAGQSMNRFRFPHGPSVEDLEGDAA